MQLVIDTDLHQAIQSIGARTPTSPIGFKSQDTPALDIYFVSQGKVLDLGESPVIKFGLVVSTAIATFLSFDATFTRQVDAAGNPNYEGFPIFNTSETVAALGALPSIQAIGEVRYQLADGEIIHVLDIPFVIHRTILTETGTPDPTVIPGYPDVAAIELRSNRDQPSGTAALDADGFLKPTDFDPTVVVLQSQHDAALGFPRLDADVLIPGAEIPVDGVTTQIVGGKVVAVGPAQGIVAVTTEAFTVPAVDATVPVSVPTGSLNVLSYYILGNGAGLYQLDSITDSTHGVFLNVGSALNAAAATVIPFGASLTWSGPPGPAGVAGVDGSAGADGAVGPTGPPGVDGTGGDMMKSIYDTANRGYADRAVLADTATALATAPAIDTIGAGTDITTNNASTSKHGLLKKLSGTATDYMDGTGAWSTPAGGGGGGGGITPIHVQVTRATNWTYADTTAMPWDSAVSDTTGMWSAGAATRLTVATAGKYLFTAQLLLTFGTVTAGSCFTIGCVVNGNLPKVHQVVMGVSGQGIPVAISGVLDLAATDYVELMGITIAGTLPTNVTKQGSAFSPYSPFMSLDLIG